MVVINGEEKDAAGKTVLEYLEEAGFDTGTALRSSGLWEEADEDEYYRRGEPGGRKRNPDYERGTGPGL